MRNSLVRNLRKNMHLAVWVVYVLGCIVAAVGSYALVEGNVLLGAWLLSGAAAVGFAFSVILARFVKTLGSSMKMIDSFQPQLDTLFENNPQLEKFANDLFASLVKE